eukprot:COSAG06_NODE_51907_length_309_cov_0.728571_1_plen_64_part_01
MLLSWLRAARLSTVSAVMSRQKTALVATLEYATADARLCSCRSGLIVESRWEKAAQSSNLWWRC